MKLIAVEFCRAKGLVHSRSHGINCIARRAEEYRPERSMTRPLVVVTATVVFCSVSLAIRLQAMPDRTVPSPGPPNPGPTPSPTIVFSDTPPSSRQGKGVAD